MGDRRLSGDPLGRDFFDRPAERVAADLLGRVLEHHAPDGLVAVRLTEVEAYAGEADPASHAYRGRTPRNAVMYGPPGHAYVYFTYGMHYCVNLVCRPAGVAAAVLLRAGEVIAGLEVAARRRPGASRRDLARGPGRLCRALAIDRALDGADVCGPGGALRIRSGAPPDPGALRTGPRTGVAAGKEAPWRFYCAGEPSVSPYRAHTPRARRATPAPAPPEG